MSTSVLLKELAERLARCKPTSMSVRDDTVSFEAGPFRFVLSTHLLVVISRGTVVLAKHGAEIAISYQLRFNELVLAGSLMSCIFALSPPVHWAPRLLVFLVFWLFLVGGNYVWSVYQFRYFLRKAVRDVTKQAE